MAFTKKILVDLSALRFNNCGLFQIAYNYGCFYKNEYQPNKKYTIYLLVPPNMVGAFGNKVKYIPANWFYKHFQWFIPPVKVWHSIHQLSKYEPKHLNTKYILTIHDLNFLYEKAGDKIEKYRRKIQKEVDRADIIVVISEFTKKEIEEHLSLKNKPVHIIYNGIKDFDETHEKRPEFVNESKPFFFSIGQIKRKKNFHVLVPMMKLFPQYNLYISGLKDDKYADKIETMIKQNELDNVFLTGEIDHNEKIWMYKHCKAFLFPSLFEGFGMPVIEALKLGAPVFSSQETSLKEIGANHVFFWDNFEAKHMKNAIEKGLKYFEQHPEMAIENKQYAKSFSFKEHIENYLKLYYQ